MYVGQEARLELEKMSLEVHEKAMRDREAQASETALLRAELDASEQGKARLRGEVAAQQYRRGSGASGSEEPPTAELRAALSEFQAERKAFMEGLQKERAAIAEERAAMQERAAMEEERAAVDDFMDAVKARRCSVAEPTNG